MTTQKFDIDSLSLNPNAQVILALPGFSNSNSINAGKFSNRAKKGVGLSGTVDNAVVGILTGSGFTLGGSNNFVDTMDSSKLESITRLEAQLRSGASSVGVDGLLQQALSSTGLDKSSFKSVQATLSNWSSSTKPVFQIQMLVLATREGDNVLEEYKKLIQTVYPVRHKGNNTFLPPLGYKSPKTGQEAKYSAEAAVFNNTMTLAVGTYFRAPRLVMNNVECTFSEVMKSGNNPLYMNVSMSLSPVLLPSAEEMVNYVRLGTV